MILNGGTVVTTSIVIQEVLQGSRTEEQFTALRRQLASVYHLEPLFGVDSYVEAARIYARCRWGGVTPRSAADCLIVRIAVEHGVPLFHDDHDFERIARFVPGLALV